MIDIHGNVARPTSVRKNIKIALKCIVEFRRFECYSVRFYPALKRVN